MPNKYYKYFYEDTTDKALYHHDPGMDDRSPLAIKTKVPVVDKSIPIVHWDNPGSFSFWPVPVNEPPHSRPFIDQGLIKQQSILNLSKKLKDSYLDRKKINV